jgi:hypothetical protein
MKSVAFCTGNWPVDVCRQTWVLHPVFFWYVPAWRSTSVTSYTEPREVQQSVQEARKRFAVIITFRKSNKNSPVQDQILKMLPCWPDALRIPTEEAVYSEFSGIVETSRRMLILVLPDCANLFYIFIFETSRQISHKVLKPGGCCGQGRAKLRGHVTSLAPF